MKREPFFRISVTCGIVIMAFIILPLIQLLTSPSVEMLTIPLFRQSMSH
jgi:hypothetical protein